MSTNLIQFPDFLDFVRVTKNNNKNITKFDRLEIENGTKKFRKNRILQSLEAHIQALNWIVTFIMKLRSKDASITKKIVSNGFVGLSIIFELHLTTIFDRILAGINMHYVQSDDSFTVYIIRLIYE